MLEATSVGHGMRCVAATALLLVARLCAHSQDISSAAQAPAPSNGAVMAQLFGPKYPPLAQSARIAGDVKLTLGIRKDGSIDTVVLVSGPPMLTQAALDSARQSRFECPGCTDEVTTYSLVYSFQIIAGPDFPCPKSHQHFTRSGNRVTVTGEPRLVDPYFSNVQARSVKCLYMWKCGSDWGGKDYYTYPVRSAKCMDLWKCGHRQREPYATCKRLGREIW
jgi:TonB family protein